jgi:polyisoprenoid-binding protein YceI
MKTRSASPAPVRLGVALAAAVALASPALAAETYQFDKSHTTVGFEVRHIFTMLGGKFQDFSGTIRIDRAKPESSSVEFTIQAASIFTNDAKRDEHLKSPDFFDTATHPTITFKSTAVKPAGDNVYQVTGNLTMRGVTKQVTLPVTLLGEGKDPWGNEKIGFETSTTLNRKDYGINWNKALDQGGVLVGDEVKVEVSVEANKVKQTAEAR